jgi:hypothetical protein
MFKKSHALSIAGIFLAVLFVLAGCQNPEAPVVNQGDTSVQFPEFPEQVGPGTVTVDINNPESTPALPEGFTYPNGAKVLAGNAFDISLAFNGGILVADTSDADGTSVSGAGAGNGTGYAYAQDGVDQIIWTGPGERAKNPNTNDQETLGSLVVPPGKTLFIAAPLRFNANLPTANTPGQYFMNISVSDAGGYVDGTPVESILLAANGEGGANVTPGGAPGKIVILAGGLIEQAVPTALASAPSFILGGELEIHRGAGLNLFNKNAPAYDPAFITTPDSTTVVYGTLDVDDNAGNVFNGAFDIKAGGTVNLGSIPAASNVDLDLNGKVTLASNGGLVLPPLTSAAVNFNGGLEVAPGVTLTLASETNFNSKAVIKGYLDLNSKTWSVSPTGHLAIESSGTIGNGDWSDAGLGSSHLLQALTATEPEAKNGRVTIAAGTGENAAVKLGLSVEADSYADLVALAKMPDFHLDEITYAGAAISLTADELEVKAGNHVNLSAATAIGNVTVESGGALTLGAAVVTAGEITVVGGGRPESLAGPFTLAPVTSPLVAATATFATRLGALTIGDKDNGTKTAVSLPVATLASSGYDGTVITVNKNAVLTLTSTVAVDPPNKITLAAGTKGTETVTGVKGGIIEFSGTGTSGPLFTKLTDLVIEDEAEFVGRDADTVPASINTITFAGIQTLTVDGLLDIPSSGLTFAYLQDNVSEDDDVSGKGTAKFAGYGIAPSGAKITHHAFDQLLAINDLTVASLTDVPKTSGFDKTTVTPDKHDDTKTGTLRVVGAIALTNIDDFTVDRNLDLVNAVSVITLASNKNLTIGAKAAILSAGITAIGGDDQAEVVLVPGGATTIGGGTAGQIDIGVSSLTLRPAQIQTNPVDNAAKTLLVPGTISLASTGSFGAGSTPATIGITLPGESSLKGANVIANAPNATSKNATATIFLANADSKLTVDGTGLFGTDTGVSFGSSPITRPGSSIKVTAGAEIVVTSGSTLRFGIASEGVTLGEGSLKAIKDVTITASQYNDGTVITNITKLEGDAELKGGATVLSVPLPTTNISRLNIAGSVALYGGTSRYDYVKVSNTTFDGNGTGGGTVFNGTNLTITVGTAGKTTGGGTLKTSGTTGKFLLGAVELTTGNSELTLPAYAGSGVITGNLDLGASGTLKIPSGTLTVGSSTVGGTLTVGTGSTINLSGIINLAAEGKGTLTFNGYTLKGVAAGAALSSMGVTPETGGTLTANDLFGEFGGSNGLTITGLTKVELDGSGGAVKITGSGNTITSTSNLYDD